MFKQKPDLVLLLTKWVFLMGLLEFVKPIQSDLGLQYCVLFKYPSDFCGTISQWEYSILFALQMFATLVVLSLLLIHHREWLIRTVNRIWDKNVSIWYYVGFGLYCLSMFVISLIVLIGLIIMDPDGSATLPGYLYTVDGWLILVLFIYSIIGSLYNFARWSTPPIGRKA